MRSRAHSLWYTRGHATLAACLLSACLTACGEEVVANPTAQGALGESCRKAAHCEDGLRCIDGVCTGSAVIDGTPPGEVRGGPGETCKRRADCELGLACVDQLCVGTEVHAGDDVRLGARFESCISRNDCQAGLACLIGKCIEPERVPAIAQQECIAIECITHVDCCDGFRPGVPTADCDNYQARCAEGTASSELYCAAFRTNCECRKLCSDLRCIADLSCSSDLDCGVGGVLRCRSGRCRRCAADADCGAGEVCRDGNCEPGCESDEACGAFARCESGRCTESACTRDRDCQVLTGDARSTCADGLCDTPCDQDFECPSFHACVEHSCTFVGCETDAECRAYLDLNGLPPGSSTTALCVIVPEED